MSPLTITIKDWSAWAPGLHTPEDWQQWAAGQKTIGGDTQPDVKAIPAMLRRRLSPLGKMALATALPLIDDAEQNIPSVLVSRHGDLNRTLALLTDLANGEDLSPTHFSLSVHNAIGGLLSITRKDTSSMTALACGAEDISTALLEAQAILTEQNCKQVLCLIYDEPIPDVYRNQNIVLPCHPYATAFLLEDASKSTSPGAIRLQLELRRRGASESGDLNDGNPQTLTFLRWILSASHTENTLELPGQRNCWHWSLAC